MRDCTQCGNVLQPDQAFCVQCGKRVQVEQVSAAAESEPILAELVEEVAANPATDPSQQIVPHPSWMALLSNAKMRRRIAGALVKALAVNGILTALVMIPGLLLCSWHPLAGMIWLFAGSFGLMARTYSKPWRLMGLTCLLPALVAAASYGFQWWMFGDAAPHATWTLLALAAGSFVGVLRGQTHALYLEQGSVMAKRTVMYLVIWALAFILTQVFRTIGAAEPLVHGGLLTSAFTSAMLIAVSLTILAKYQSIRSQLTATAGVAS